MPPIVIKKGIVGNIWGVPVSQSQALPFRHGEFMHYHAQNLDGIARVSFHEIEGYDGKNRMIRTVSNMLRTAERVRFRDMDDFLFKRFKIRLE